MGTGSHGHGHGHGHGHSHNHNSHGHSHESAKTRCCKCTDQFRLSSMLFLVFGFFLVEIIVGHRTGSVTLIADSFHMLSDALALCIGLFTTIISKRSHTSKNTYGWVRAEVLGPFTNSVFLISLCLHIVIDAVERLVKPEAVENVDELLATGTLGLLINLVGLVFLGHGHSHDIETAESEEIDDDVCEMVQTIRRDDGTLELDQTLQVGEQRILVKQLRGSEAKEREKETKKCCAILSSKANMNMRAVFLHVLADALGSVVVIFSAILNIYKTELQLPERLIDCIDPILCLCLVTLILSSTTPLLKESGLILLQTVPKQIEVSKLKEDLVSEIPGVANVHELHIWKLSGTKIIATAHVTCHTSTEYMKVAAGIKEFFHKKGIHSTTIQPEFSDLIHGANTDCIPDTCCGPQIDKNKSIASQLKEQV